MCCEGGFPELAVVSSKRRKLVHFECRFVRDHLYGMELQLMGGGDTCHCGGLHVDRTGSIRRAESKLFRNAGDSRRTGQHIRRRWIGEAFTGARVNDRSCPDDISYAQRWVA